jgi:hypothetical protein
MNITPEDLIYGLDPFKEDPSLGFKKLKKGAFFEVALRMAMREYNIETRDAIDRILDTSKHSIYLTKKYFVQSLIDNFISKVMEQLEADGYTQFENWTVPLDAMAEMATWCVDEMIKQGIIPNDQELIDKILRSYK